MSSKGHQLSAARSKLGRLEREAEVARQRYAVSRSRSDLSAMRSVEKRLEQALSVFNRLKAEADVAGEVSGPGAVAPEAAAPTGSD